MPKTKISEYSTTNSDNTDIESINIAEGCAPSGINNAIRELMVHLKEFQTGSSGDPLTVAGAFVASAGVTANTLTLTGILTASGGTILSSTNTLSGSNIISGNINSSGTNTFSGSSVMSFSGGTSASPSIYFASDTNTGIFSPAADTIAAATGGTERLRIDSSGYVGIGTTNPSGSDWNANSRLLHIYQNTTNGSLLKLESSNAVGVYAVGNAQGQIGMVSNHPFLFYTNSTERMRIDSSGNVGIGTSSPVNYSNYKGLTVADTTGGFVHLRNTANSHQAELGLNGANGAAYLATYTSTPIQFLTNSAERARITSGGEFLVGTTSAALDSSPGIKLANNSSTDEPQIGVVTNRATNLSIYHLYNTNATNNGYRWYVNLNGGVSNYSGNNVNLSDERAKTNIELAGNYLDKICSIPVKLFNYKDEPNGEQRTLGVIAQDVEAAAPELVDANGWEGNTPKDGIPLKSVYTTDMMFAMMKSIQELKAITDAQATRIEALEAEVAAMKAN